MHVCWSVQWASVLAKDQILYQVVKVKNKFFSVFNTER